MSQFKLSTYQENILNFIKTKSGNLLVDAKAGSGKTLTLLLISNYLKEINKHCLFLAFNKTIVEELETKLDNPLCEVKTIHSTGLSFVRSYLYRIHGKDYELEIDEGKVRKIVKKYFEEDYKENVIEAAQEVYNYNEKEIKDLCNQIISELTRLVDFCRFYMVNYHYKDNVEETALKCCYELIIRPDKIGMKDYYLCIEKTIDTIKQMFENPIKNEVTGKPHYVIDYTDMVYFPVYYNMYVPASLKSNLDYILVDEAQDLSILDQNLVKKLNIHQSRFTQSRFIFVGDEKQAIYGFAGADTNSINNIKANFKLEELPLNICYRCPERVVKLARKHVPDIEWNTARDDKGIIGFLQQDELPVRLKPKDIIIGRQNYRLVELYKELCLDKHIKVKFKNTKLIKQIVNEITSAVTDYISRYNSFQNIEVELYTYMDKEMPGWQLIERDPEVKRKKHNKILELLQKNKKSGKKISRQNYSVDYLKTCMNEYKEKGAYNYVSEVDATLYYDLIVSFIDMFKKESSKYTVESFLKYIEDFLMSNSYSDVPIISSVHQMKGGEANRIFILDYPLFPFTNNKSGDDIQQEYNLEYVAITRSKSELYLLLMDKDHKPRSFKQDVWDKGMYNTLNRACKETVKKLLGEDKEDEEKLELEIY